MSSRVILEVKLFIYCYIAMTVVGEKGFFLQIIFQSSSVIFLKTLISYQPLRAIKALSSDYSRNPEGILVVTTLQLIMDSEACWSDRSKGRAKKVTVNGEW